MGVSTRGAEINKGQNPRIATAKSMEGKSKNQMFVEMQDHGGPGLLIFTNITPQRVQPTEMGLNGVKTHGFRIAFRGLRARMA